jgi:platelet-activating factor acetylhydrolase IB subunit alpha
VCFIPPGDYLASCSRDNSIKIWEAATGYCVKTIEGHVDWVRCIVASPDGKYLASGSNDHSVRIWDVDSGKCVVELHEHSHVVETVAFAPAEACAAIVESVGTSGQLGTGTVGGDSATGEGEADYGMGCYFRFEGQIIEALGHFDTVMYPYFCRAR